MLGLSQDWIAPWEDGMRTSGGPKSYEWWYFDAHLEDGSSLVVTFFTKPSLATWSKLSPQVSVELERPGHEKLELTIKSRREDSEFSTDRCDVRIGESTFRDLGDRYEIHVVHPDLVIDVVLRAQVPAWRPKTGHFFFGAHDEHLFAWLPTVPQGTVTAMITSRGTTAELNGIGYHDHNWGDATMMRLMNHWYWGRAQAGPYSVIASWLVAEKKYGDTEIPIFMLSKDGQIIADDATKASLDLFDVSPDRESGKPVADRIVYTYHGDQEQYRVTFAREKTIARILARNVDVPLLRIFVRLARVDGAYLRFTGTVTVERIVNGTVVETQQDPGIWELTYFGRTRAPAGTVRPPRAPRELPHF
ncbi:hydroxyneurosporene dehydrogenase [Plantibacter sp. Mn2098]|uniref:hydroxyneurosporene dehydrogenase n=1 Tax=Plantibacter sp. Mn2098 TaxID=3395266 RepID=UPI003BDE2D29